MELLLILILWLHLLLLMVLMAVFASSKSKTEQAQTHPPFVSVLVPARNEAHQIEACLLALTQVNYPKEKLEILVGNDNSEDHTAAVVQRFVDEYDYIKLISIEGNLGSAKAKGNVLAHLIKEAKAEFLFVTDADIQVHQEWIQQLLPKLQQGVAIASGTTVVKGSKPFHHWQSLEWLLGNGYILSFFSLGVPTTAVGNNMAFTKEAYYKTGGYERMPFSVTEDFQLYYAMHTLGLKVYNEGHPNSVNISAPQWQVKQFLHQRKRWLMGAMGLPWYWLIIFGLQAAFFPALIILLFIHVKVALQIFLFKAILQQIYIDLLLNKLKIKMSWLWRISFEAYMIWSTFAMVFFFLGKEPMNWKNRKY